MEAIVQSQQCQTQQQQHQQISFHFWNCQLTSAKPKYCWDPENWSAAATAGEHRQRRTGRHGNADTEEGSKEDGSKEDSDKANTGDANGNEKANEAKSSEENGGNANSENNGAEKEDPSTNDADDNGEEVGEDSDEAVVDADYMQHVLKVSSCVLGPTATGIHLISVRTRCYQSEPDTCPLVCIDPASQRTITLGHEFVLDSQNEVTFELAEGTGPVWLTGLHQVRVHDDGAGDENGDADANLLESIVNEEDEAEDEEAAAGSDESMKDIEEEDEEDEEEEEESENGEEEEEEEEEEDEDEDEEEEMRPPPKRAARASKTERPVASPKQQQRRRAPVKAVKAKSPLPSASSKTNGVKRKAAAASKKSKA